MEQIFWQRPPLLLKSLSALWERHSNSLGRPSVFRLRSLFLVLAFFVLLAIRLCVWLLSVVGSKCTFYQRLVERTSVWISPSCTISPSSTKRPVACSANRETGESSGTNKSEESGSCSGSAFKSGSGLAETIISLLSNAVDMLSAIAMNMMCLLYRPLDRYLNLNWAMGLSSSSKNGYSKPRTYALLFLMGRAFPYLEGGQ
jgi:hypothetical protein